MRPWSTNTQVSCFPTARESSTAATGESTPPDSPSSTRSLPIFLRSADTVSSINVVICQSPAQRHTPNTKFESTFMPSFECVTSGWNCTA